MQLFLIVPPTIINIFLSDENLKRTCFGADINLPSGNIDNVSGVKSPEACQEECRKIDNCVAWTLAPDSKCWRKHTGHEDISLKKSPYSGPRDCVGRLFLLVLQMKFL